MSLEADLKTHKIEGIARMGNTPFAVPLFSQIDGNLWQGGCPVESAPEEFKFIICLYPWGVYRIEEHQIFTAVHLYDEGEIPNIPLIYMLARHVNECRKIGPTLVHCQAGLNRSALVAGLALIESGMQPVEAVALLRQQRSPAVLCNEVFQNWLLSLA